jgi:hypothetical protein
LYFFFLYAQKEKGTKKKEARLQLRSYSELAATGDFKTRFAQTKKPPSPLLRPSLNAPALTPEAAHLKRKLHPFTLFATPLYTLYNTSILPSPSLLIEIAIALTIFNTGG